MREIGVDKIEVCAIHADFSKPEAFKDVVKTYKDAGVSIISLGVETFVGDPKERNTFECAKLAGAKHISVHFQVGTFPKAIEQSQKLCDEYGIRPRHPLPWRLHVRRPARRARAPDQARLAADRALASIRLGACRSGRTAASRLSGVKQKFAGKVYGIHYKDFTFGKNGQWTDVVVGEGNLDLPGFIKALDETNFDGMAVIEYEADPQNPVPALTNCVKAMRSAGKA